MHRRTITFCSYLAGLSWLVLAANFAAGVSNDATRCSFCLAALFSGLVLWMRVGFPVRPLAETERRNRQRVLVVVSTAIAATAWFGLAIWSLIGEPSATTRCLFALAGFVSVNALGLRITRSSEAYAAGHAAGYELGRAVEHKQVIHLDDLARKRLDRPHRQVVIHREQVHRQPQPHEN